MYGNCRETVQQALNCAESISLTTDIWTSISNESFISLTAHFVDAGFNYKHFVLNVKHFEGSHTADKIANILFETMDEWNIRNKLYVLVRDSGANIKKAATDMGIGHESCFIHTLQLVVTSSLNA